MVSMQVDGSESSVRFRTQYSALSTACQHSHNIFACNPSQPIAIAPDLRDKQFDYMSSAKNVQISDSRAVIMDGCEVTAAYGVKDIVITDMDGSFDPSRNGTMGSIVQDYDHVKGILGEGACSSIGKCLAFCPNACLRKFSLKVEQFGTENWKLRVSAIILFNVVIGVINRIVRFVKLSRLCPHVHRIAIL